MTKTLEENFRDWEANVFGFGYGSGETHTIPALKVFLELCNEGSYGHSYDHRKLEVALTPTVAWLLINILCKHSVDILEYGTSPRYAWLTKRGEALKEFVSHYTAEQLIDIACDHDQDYVHCYPDACNCGSNGYEEEKECPNPFWQPDAWHREHAS
jgi:hypothetical protein